MVVWHIERSPTVLHGKRGMKEIDANVDRSGENWAEWGHDPLQFQVLVACFG